MVRLAVCRMFFNKNADRQVLEDKWENVEVDPTGLVEILKEGHPICVSDLNSNLREETQFKSSQVIGVDFDQGPDVEYFSRVDAFARKYAAVIYSTVSSTDEKPRTRLLFVLDEPVTSADEYKHQVTALLGRFRQFGVDEVCKSSVQVFFGNSKGDYRINPEARIPKELISELINVYQKPAQDTEKKKTSDILSTSSSNGSRNNDAVALVAKYANVLPAPDIEAIMHLWYNQLADKTDFPFASVQTIIRHYTEKSAPVLKSVERAVHTVIQPEAAPKDLRKMATPFYDFHGKGSVEWQIENWLPVATTAMMVAPPQHFKTWISLAIAMSLGMNKPLFGEFKIVKPCRVLIMQQEDSRNITSSRSTLIFEELSKSNPRAHFEGDMVYTGIVLPNVSYYTSDTTFTFSSESSLRNLEALIKDQHYGLVIIDPLYAATDSADYMAKDANRMVELKRIRDRLGTSFLVLHHTRKTTTLPSPGQPLKANRLDAWGSQFLNAWQETGIQIRGTEDPKSMAVTRYFKSSGDVFTGIFSFDIETKPEDPRFNVTNVQAKDGSKISALDILMRGPITVTDFARLAGVSTSTASRQLAKMLQKGAVKKMPNQSYALNQDDSDL